MHTHIEIAHASSSGILCRSHHLCVGVVLKQMPLRRRHQSHDRDAPWPQCTRQNHVDIRTTPVFLFVLAQAALGRTLYRHHPGLPGQDAEMREPFRPRLLQQRPHRLVHYPEGPSTQYLRTLVPKAINGMVFGTRVLNYWVLGPSGLGAPGASVHPGPIGLQI